MFFANGASVDGAAFGSVKDFALAGVASAAHRSITAAGAAVCTADADVGRLVFPVPFLNNVQRVLCQLCGLLDAFSLSELPACHAVHAL